MAFLGGLGLLANLAQGYQNQQQQGQQLALQRQRMALEQAEWGQRAQQFALEQQQHQKQIAGAGLFIRSLLSGGGGGGGQPDVSALGGLAGQPQQGSPTQLTPQQSYAYGGASAPVPRSMTSQQAQATWPTVVQRESGGRNIPNEQGPGGAPASSASGLAQELTSTWQQDAPKAGVDIRRYPTAMSAPPEVQKQVGVWQLQNKGLQPWATRSGNLHGAFAPGQGAAPATNPPPPPPPGGYDIASLARSIERANPGIDDETLFYAISAGTDLMSKNTKDLWDRYEKVREFQIREEDTKAQREATNELARERLGQGQQRLEIQKGTPASQSEVDFWTKVIQNGGSLPPGLSRTATGSKLVQQIMANTAEGTTPGGLIAGQAGTKANQSSLSNMTKMADAATSFERTASRNFDLALKLSKDAIPTDWGPWLNKWIENGETQAGNADVPPYVTAMLTAANEYAKIMSGSTGSQGSTVDSRREAAELFSPYLSQGQIERVVGIAKADMANRKASLYGQVDDIKGRLKSGGASPSLPAGEGGGNAGVPVPPSNAKDPDGTRYQGSDGKTYVKQGDKMVAQ